MTQIEQAPLLLSCTFRARSSWLQYFNTVLDRSESSMPKRRLTQLVLTADVLVIGRHHDTVEASIPEAAVNSCLDFH
jgi:hypothetical protein